MKSINIGTAGKEQHFILWHVLVEFFASGKFLLVFTFQGCEKNIIACLYVIGGFIANREIRIFYGKLKIAFFQKRIAKFIDISKYCFWFAFGEIFNYLINFQPFLSIMRCIFCLPTMFIEWILNAVSISSNLSSFWCSTKKSNISI